MFGLSLEGEILCVLAIFEGIMTPLLLDCCLISLRSSKKMGDSLLTGFSGSS